MDRSSVPEGEAVSRGLLAREAHLEPVVGAEQERTRRQVDGLDRWLRSEVTSPAPVGGASVTTRSPAR